jgi:hypothetical protein
VCSGKPFAEMVVRLIAPVLIYKYDVDFSYQVKPALNIDIIGDPDIIVKVAHAATKAA